MPNPRLIITSVVLVLAPSRGSGQHLAFRDSGQTFVVTNHYYTASINKQTGELYSVVDHLRGRTAISGDRLIVRVVGRRDSIGPADFSATRFSIADGLDFYLRVVWQGALPGSGGKIERTYEFTNSPYVYEQVVIAAEGMSAGQRVPTIPLQEVTWEFRRENDSVTIGRTAEDLWTELPGSAMGGLELTLPDR